jgi:acyl-CoA thioester hydrolase
MPSRYSPEDYPTRIELPVLWGDMDAFQHVNNVQYFRYFESVRIAYFDQIGFTETMNHLNVGPILAETSCRFRFPLHYPETITACTKVSLTGPDTFTMDYMVWSQSKNDAAALGTGKIVCLDYKAGKRVSLPQAIIDAMQALDPSSVS